MKITYVVGEMFSSEHLNFSPRPMTECINEYFFALASFDPFLVQNL
jgi:hypothetical protein